ncbi:uncharacterized protein LOC115756102 [Rhodamnia argentea]|uniref:Uncharacterized protein LOC115756102 n=1 Tax=Rhodamnia argentea TaxID=178133 RepID=A0A8B8QWR5_9MYRT|nr:uncharacterized protein LOC115756102 [Rhodamnia argentea]
MGKKRGGGRSTNQTASHSSSITLREETTGRKQPSKGEAHANPKSILKLQHLRKLAEWTGREASIPSLSAFFGRRLASVGESLRVPPDPSLVSCQRCETVLQPGYNCTIRIEKNRPKSQRRRRKPFNATQNVVVYMCHFCSHRNLKRGTDKGHMKELCPMKAKSTSQLKPPQSEPLVSCGQSMGSGRGDETKEASQMSSPAVKVDTLAKVSPPTPLTKTLLDGKRQKRSRSGAKRQTQPESADAEATAGASSKRRRKSWTSLKEIAESSEHGTSRNIASLKIPFCI